MQHEPLARPQTEADLATLLYMRGSLRQLYGSWQVFVPVGMAEQANQMPANTVQYALTLIEGVHFAPAARSFRDLRPESQQLVMTFLNGFNCVTDCKGNKHLPQPGKPRAGRGRGQQQAPPAQPPPPPGPQFRGQLFLETLFAADNVLRVAGYRLVVHLYQHMALMMPDAAAAAVQDAEPESAGPPPGPLPPPPPPLMFFDFAP